MRLHTNTLNESDLQKLMKYVSNEAPNVILHVTGLHGARNHKRGIEIALRGHGTRHKRPPQTRILGEQSTERAATVDDWGWLIAAVFAVEPGARFGPYKGADDFAKQTRNKYAL